MDQFCSLASTPAGVLFWGCTVFHAYPEMPFFLLSISPIENWKDFFLICEVSTSSKEIFKPSQITSKDSMHLDFLVAIFPVRQISQVLYVYLFLPQNMSMMIQISKYVLLRDQNQCVIQKSKSFKHFH